jgi:hypothetical protein
MRSNAMDPIYTVYTNKYAHEGSAYERRDAQFTTLKAAIRHADKIVPTQRWARVAKCGNSGTTLYTAKPGVG